MTFFDHQIHFSSKKGRFSSKRPPKKAQKRQKKPLFDHQNQKISKKKCFFSGHQKVDKVDHCSYQYFQDLYFMKINFKMDYYPYLFRELENYVMVIITDYYFKFKFVLNEINS